MSSNITLVESTEGKGFMQPAVAGHPPRTVGIITLYLTLSSDGGYLEREHDLINSFQRTDETFNNSNYFMRYSLVTYVGDSEQHITQ